MSRLPLTGAGPSAGYSAKVLRLAPIAYWPLWEASGTTADNLEGTVALDGTYNSDVSGWPPGTGIGDGNSAATFDGSNDRVDIYSASFNTAFDPTEGSYSIWVKITDSAVWEGATYRKILVLTADANNKVEAMRWGGTNDQVFSVWKAGGTQEFVNWDGSGTLNWFHMAQTWSVTGDAMKLYINGSQTGSTQTGLDTWVGALDSDITLLGADEWAGGGSEWKGLLAHCAVWDTPLSGTQIATLAEV